LAERISLHVNGIPRELEVEPDTPLLYVLRNDLGLKGAKFGCGLEQCGACAVIVDGRSALSCREPVSAFVGRQVTTLEGLGTVDALHPVQEAFLEEQAAQCGYCTSGLIVAATALLHENPMPSDREIRAALAAHLCRCGAHGRVIAAVKRAARTMAP
jgi:nicotinate dehydrogenase subunit A